MIRAYRGIVPSIAASAYVDPSAQLIGDVTIGERSSVWANASIRGDVNYIRIGEESNVQDNSCLHVESETNPLIVGNRVTVGHAVTLHGCEVEDDCLIGIGALVLSGARIRRGSIVGAGALVPEGMEVPADSIVMGVPAKVRRTLTEAERERVRESAAAYVRLLRTYKEEPL